MNRAEYYTDKKNWFHSLLDTDELQMLIVLAGTTIVEKVSGDWVELGCHRGGTTLALAELLRDAKCGKVAWGFDTFTGHPEADARGSFAKGELDLLEEDPELFNRLIMNDLTLEGYAGFVKGDFRKTLWEQYGIHRPASFVFFDCDLQQSMAAGYGFFLPRLSAGSVIVFHDYGYERCPGVKEFVDDFVFSCPRFSLVGNLRNMRAFRFK